MITGGVRQRANEVGQKHNIYDLTKILYDLTEVAHLFKGYIFTDTQPHLSLSLSGHYTKLVRQVDCYFQISRD